MLAGFNCVGCKEFMMIFNITCMVPFIRPSLPPLQAKDIDEKKIEEKKRV